MIRHRTHAIGARRQARRVAATVAVALAAIASHAGAQGSISMQGFGYPIGGLSTRASGTAGAIADFDLLTPRNPASLTGFQRSVLLIQAEPEHRSLTLGSIKENTSVQRIPLLMMGLRLTSRAVVAISDAGYLDRSYSTASTGTALVDGVLLATEDNETVKGAISDFRAGLGWQLTSRVSIGIAGHVFTGDNTQRLTRQFSDTLSFGTVSDTSGVDFLGRAISVGGEAVLPKGFGVSVSYRAGGEMREERRSTIIRRAKVPNLLSAGLLYNGLTGATFVAHVDKTNWTALSGLGSTTFETHDATNWSIGAEITGQRIRGNNVEYRLGTGRNQLPFGINGAVIREQRIGGGVSVPLTAAGREQAAIDFSLQRAIRRMSVGAARENAWLFGVGLQIRP